jgi:2-iminobutanoate/2-iminopropanoate deaminase
MGMAAGNTVTITPINATNAPVPTGGYSQAIELSGADRVLYISGQIPESATGEVPDTFEAQARLVWQHIVAQLEAARMTTAHLVKVTTFLSSREHADINGMVRREVLGTHAPALTVIITGIYDPRWLLEIEAVAAGSMP